MILKSTLSNIKELLKNKTSTTSISQRFNIKNHCTENKQIIANRFNTYMYFTNRGATLVNKIINSGIKTFRSYLNKPSKKTFQFTPVTKTVVKNIIKQLIGKSSQGAYGLSAK